MKKSANTAIVEAENAFHAAQAEHQAAREAMERARLAEANAYAALYKVRVEADAALPQCRVVRYRGSSAREEVLHRGVILRQTSAGLLVVRPVGQPEEQAEKFKRSKTGSQFVKVKSSDYWGHTEELRDVPDKYLGDLGEMAAK